MSVNMHTPAKSKDTGLSISNLSAGYRRRKVLEELQLPELESGTVLGVIGRNGAGKSTLLKTLAGLLSFDGDICLDGELLPNKPRMGVSRRVGYLPQTLPQGTTLIAYESVYSAFRANRSDIPRQRMEALIEQVFDRLGIRHLALRRLNELSGGQRQMIGLAQVLARQPRLLLLDEPTSALDLHWQLSVLEAVRDVARDQGAIALVSIHDINLALRFCDRLMVLADGKLLASGESRSTLTPEVLRQAYGVEARIEYCSQGRPLVLCDSAL